MPAKRKAAFEVPLHGEGVSLHEPGAVRILRAEQERHASAVHRVGGGYARKMQRVQRLAGGVSIGRRAAELRPTAAGFLAITNFLNRSSHTSPPCIRPHQ